MCVEPTETSFRLNPLLEINMLQLLIGDYMYLKGLCQIFLEKKKKKFQKGHLHQWKPVNNGPVLLKVTSIANALKLSPSAFSYG